MANSDHWLSDLYKQLREIQPRITAGISKLARDFATNYPQLFSPEHEEQRREIITYITAIDAFHNHLEAAQDDPAVKAHPQVHAMVSKLIEDISDLGPRSTDISLATRKRIDEIKAEARTANAKVANAKKHEPHRALKKEVERIALKGVWKSKKDAARRILKEIELLPEWKTHPLKGPNKERQILRWLPTKIKTERASRRRK